MSLFDFLAPRRVVPTANPLVSPDDLVFKDAMAAVEYAREFMKTEWRDGHVSIALLGEAMLRNGKLFAPVLVPRGDQFQELPTFTSIVAKSSPGSRAIDVSKASDISQLGLSYGDLITVAFSGKSNELAREMPETEGWMASVVARNLPRFSIKYDGWVVDTKFHL